MSYDPNAASSNQYTGGQLRARRFGAKLTPSNQERKIVQEQQLDFPPASSHQVGGAGLMGSHWASQLPFQSPPQATPSSWNPSPAHQFPTSPFTPSQAGEPTYMPHAPSNTPPEASAPVFPPPKDPILPLEPRPRKRGKKPLLIIALLAVILIGGVGYYIYSYTRIAQQTHESNTRAATATVEVNTQATALAASYPFSKDLALNDALKDNSQKQGWMEDRYCKFGNNSYQARDPEKNSYYTCPALKTKFTNFTYQVSMQITKGSMAGLTFRGDDVKYKYYAFIFNSDGSYALLLYTGRDKSPQSLYTGISTQFKARDENQVAISAIGSTIRLFVNRQLLASVEDDTLTQGQIGVVVYTQKDETQATFKDAKVWRVA